jgi:hypothetical protein
MGEVDPGLLKYGPVSEHTSSSAAAAFTLPGVLFESCLAVLFL